MSPFQLFSLLLLAAAGSVAYATTTCNVLNYGGVADGKTDIAPAIMKAYSNCVARATTRNPVDTVLLVPEGNYALRTPVSFYNADYFTIETNGVLNLVFNASLGGSMFLFDHCNYVVWKGCGTINGNGHLWRPNNNLVTYPRRPRLLRFQDCNYADISGVTLVNSPMFHVSIIGNGNVAHDMTIRADHIGETDGFDVSGNGNYVHDVSVENGDECVTVKTPTNGFVAENIQCRYSAGCNIGSFGQDVTGVSVQNVYYRNVTQYRGDAGILLKSYPSASGVIRNLTYVDFKLTEVAYPIQINNYWCPHESSCPPATGTVTWNDVTFRNIFGTGDETSRPTISIKCISGHKCSSISFEDVHITKAGNAKAKVEISNACGSGIRELDAC